MINKFCIKSMIQAEYINDLHNRYLVIKANREYSNSHEVAMITGNLIPGFIKTELRIYDDIELLYYNITGKKELTKKYHSSFLSYENIVGLLTSIFAALETSYEYLLTENNIVMNPEYIYWDSFTEEISLCYVIGYRKDMKEQLCSLLEYLMNKVDYKDEGAVLLVYMLYKKSKDEDCTYEELKEELQVKHREKVENIKDTIKKGGISTNPTLSGSYGESIHENKGEIKLTGENNYTPLHNEVISEREVYYYPVSIYVRAGIYIGLGIFLLSLGFLFGLYDNSLGSALEPLKIICALVMIGCIQVYILSKLFIHTNKVTKMEKVTEYEENQINDFCSPSSSSIESPTEILWQSDKEENHTQVLAILKEKHTLVPKEGNENPCITINCFPFMIGKEKDKVDAVINAATISRIHCKIEEIENEVFVIDLGSTNGTYINTKRIEKLKPHKISHMDVIGFSNINYQYEIK